MIGADDLAGMFDTSDFAVTATARGQSFPVIFDRESILVAVGDVGVDSTEPTAVAQSKDVSALVEGDGISIDGSAWTLARDPRPDGTGLSTLHLREA